MRQQSYLVRKGARYHFRRRPPTALGLVHPISLALGTTDPAEARRLARRLAVKWDELAMYLVPRIERGNLTLAEQEVLFRKGLADELARATAHVTAPIGASTSNTDHHHKILAAAYRIVARVPHHAEALGLELLETEIDDSWSEAEIDLLVKTLRFMVSPMSVSRMDAKDALDQFKGSFSEGAIGEARAQILQGFAEAHDRAELLEHPEVQGTCRGVLALLDDEVVARAKSACSERRDDPPRLQNGSHPSGGGAPSSAYATPTNLRFSEIIEATLDALQRRHNWTDDNGQRLAIAERFAWLTGDLTLTEYNEGHIQQFVDRLQQIPTDFKWGKLDRSGAMDTPFDPAVIPAVTKGTTRSPRTINRDLSAMQRMSEHLSKTHWRSPYHKGLQMDFLAFSMAIEDDPADPKRVPWTPHHLKTLYSLPLWQGGGSQGNRIKQGRRPKIFQDAAYWVPLIGTYTGLAREEACGLEIEDFNFDCEVPYLLVQANMTRSKDGLTPSGLKRKSRNRIMPLHPELLELGLPAYVRAIAKERNYTPGMVAPIFPELYSDDAKLSADGVIAPQKGGKRFYAIAWRFLMDGTHAIKPLPETRDGKKADFHSQRTYNQSVLASPDVSQTILDKHMGHAFKGTGPRSYNRRALALGETDELRERLAVLVREMPNVTGHVPRTEHVELLHIRHRSRVGSADGRNAFSRFCV